MATRIRVAFGDGDEGGALLIYIPHSAEVSEHLVVVGIPYTVLGFRHVRRVLEVDRRVPVHFWDQG